MYLFDVSRTKLLWHDDHVVHYKANYDFPNRPYRITVDLWVRVQPPPSGEYCAVMVREDKLNEQYWYICIPKAEVFEIKEGIRLRAQVVSADPEVYGSDILQAIETVSKTKYDFRKTSVKKLLGG